MLTRISCDVQRTPLGFFTGSYTLLSSLSAQPLALEARAIGTNDRSQAAVVPRVYPPTATFLASVQTAGSALRQKFCSSPESAVCMLESGKESEGCRPSSSPGYISVISNCCIAPPEPPKPTVHFGTP